MDLLETLTAAGLDLARHGAAELDSTALPTSADGALSIGWPEATERGSPAVPTLTGDAGDLISLGGVLGEGGMGVVYAGIQHGLARGVAVKALRDGDDPRRLAALVREARVVGAVAHPNVVPVHLLVRDRDGLPLMVMKRIEGQSWAAHLRAEAADSPAFRLDDARLEHHLRVLMQVANALDHAHATDVIHRDVKPSNVMLGPHGEVYLVDWGLAGAVGPRAPVDLPHSPSRHTSPVPRPTSPQSRPPATPRRSDPRPTSTSWEPSSTS